jgi:hypothetical protein
MDLFLGEVINGTIMAEDLTVIAVVFEEMEGIELVKTAIRTILQHEARFFEILFLVNPLLNIHQFA